MGFIKAIIDGAMAIAFISITTMGAKAALLKMKGEALEAVQRGPIKLSDLTRSLQGDEKYCEWYTSTFKEPCPPIGKR